MINRHKKSKRKAGDSVKLEMTPMIDVVFQLLIFFIVTLKQEDILSKLEVSRPAPDPNAKKEEKADLVEIVVYDHRTLGGEGISWQGRQISFNSLDSQLGRLSSFSKDISVIIKCQGESPHENLVKVLDICARHGLRNLALFSL